CGNCDSCLNPPERHDGTVAVQKALSAMLRTGERFGVEHLIGVLRGEATDRIRQMGHDRIRTFGAGSDIAAGPWRGIFRQLYALGHASISERGGWSVTESGRAVLRGKEIVMLRRDPERKKRPVRENRAAGLAPHEQEIFESLRALRTDLARARNVPAYVIFNDASLIDMAERKPMDLDALAACHGVGAKKLAEFGDAFLQVLRAGTTERVHPARARLAGQPEGALMDRLRTAQAELSRGENGTDRYLSCTSTTLAKIAETRPRDRAALERIPGMGKQKAERFADAFLAVLHEDA
ncbi:MAG TPA: HRDC domain-containing protein, partial [Paracoccaceae bacterium]|nr:HRDC domain-containing protein [Paracoccaceae bacterium]